MIKVTKNSIFTYIYIVLIFGCSGIKEGKIQKIHQGLTIYGTYWDKNPFRPLTFSSMKTEANFIEHANNIPDELSAIIEKIKTKEHHTTPRLDFRVLLFVGTDTLMLSRDCSIVLNSVLYDVECSLIADVLEATGSSSLLEAVSFPKERYRKKD